ncbi:MAG: malto-oligosyltrehalose synthase [Verrucomicrobiota bacterium]
MHIPRATYRLQFNESFTFRNARGVLDYLQQLGVSDVYASPIFQARQGSGHGYDVVDPTALNPELGSGEDFEAYNDDLHERGMGHIQDIVPNHMAYSSENAYLMDVLENGRNSRYRRFFDVEWEHPIEGLRGRLLVPLLGSYYGEVLERGELQLKLREQGFAIAYWEQSFPLAIESYANILGRNLEALRKQLGEESNEFIKYLGILYLVRSMPVLEEIEDREQAARAATTREHELRFVKRMLWELYCESTAIRDHVDEVLATLNGTPGDPASFDDLDGIHAEQHFRLCFWKVATEEINYRRFFTVNELISVRVEDEEVFRQTHALIASLLVKGRFDGLRVDHLDGLFAPQSYLEHLRQVGPHAYLVVEKILEHDEKLPEHFPIQGTTGYTFLNYANGLFVHPGREHDLDRIYRQFTHIEEDYQDWLLARKKLVLQKSLSADIARLAVTLRSVSTHIRFGSDITFTGLTNALNEIIACMPVYRTYVQEDPVSETDRKILREAAAKAMRGNRDSAHEIEFVEKFLSLELPHLSEAEKVRCLDAVKRFQQLTGPVMAKGMEDNFLYVMNRLLSLNEVGGNPLRFGVRPDEMHAFLADAMAHWPHAMNATATHDTKRGEDARARINVLSEIAPEWEKALAKWRRSNIVHKRVAGGREVPESNTEYFLYQAMLGSVPFAGPEADEFQARLKDYFIKAVREADVRTSWLNPNEDYENGCLAFIDDLFQFKENQEFWRSFNVVARRVTFFGVLNSLAQTLLKLTSPGVPDVYQGCELWDFSFVDPDNRRPVDFQERRRQLAEIVGRLGHQRTSYLKEILTSFRDGRAKLLLTHVLLWLRHDYRHVFNEGDYLPLEANGERAENLFAFARRSGDDWIIVAVPRLLGGSLKVNQWPLGSNVWKDTRLQLPKGSPADWKRVLPDTWMKAEDGSLPAADVFTHFPVGLLLASPQK